MRVFSEVSEDGRRRPVAWPCGGGLAIEGGGEGRGSGRGGAWR